MRTAIQHVAILLVVVGAVLATGCSAAGTSRLVDRPDAAPATLTAKDAATPRLERAPVETDWVRAALPVVPSNAAYPREEGAMAPGRGWDGCCGLPCEAGCGTWHLRAVGGYQFGFGEDSGSESGYFGADAGYTFPCCIGVDVFWRTWCTEFDRDVRVPGTIPFRGTDAGNFNMIGIKATYERSFGGRLYGYGGIGPHYFWTNDYVNDDTGWGGFAELGLGYVLARNWRIRVGVEVAGLYTDAGRTNPADDGEERWLWVVSPVAQVQFDF